MTYDAASPEPPDLIAAKMAALGKMAAALTHELNNPASASQRAASELGEILRTLTELASDGIICEAGPAGADLAMHLQEAIERGETRATSSGQAVDPIHQSEREEQITAWLEARGIPESWRLAPDVVEAGLDVEWLDRLETLVRPEALDRAVTWAVSATSAGRLLSQIVDSATRISELVAAVKGYSYVDRAPVQTVDVHEGLENTLVILGHRLRQIEVVRDYDRDLPRIAARPGELNQVWTNLIDNAVDALEERGKLAIKTTLDGDRILVEIADDGPAIPPDVLPHIFEPFYTTKTLGTGLGLGLDISRRIITERHGGTMDVESVPGDTRFRVWLPIHKSVKQDTGEGGPI